MGMTSITAKCMKGPQEVAFPLQFLTLHQCDKPLVAGQKLTAPVQFSFRVVDDKEVEVVSVHCAIRADYELDKGYQPTPEEIEAFSESNAVFNCWPYFRELVQNTLARMNYPPLSIPFLRLVPKAAISANPVQSELPEQSPRKMIESPAPPRRLARKKRNKG